jgi:hypothetical protein
LVCHQSHSSEALLSTHILKLIHVGIGFRTIHQDSQWLSQKKKNVQVLPNIKKDWISSSNKDNAMKSSIVISVDLINIKPKNT